MYYSTMAEPEIFDDMEDFPPTNPELLLQNQEAGGKLVTDPEWEWPCFSRYVHNGRTRIEPLKKLRDGGSSAGSATPFTVTYTECPGEDPRVHATLFSKQLVDVVKQILPESRASFSETPELPAKSIFLALVPLKKQLVAEGFQGEDHEEGGGPAAERRCHLQHLVRFLEQEFKETIVRREQMEAKGKVSYDMLWTVMLPQEPVRFFCSITNRPLLGILKKCGGHQDEEVFRVWIEARDYNVQSYRKSSVQGQIIPFHGEVAFTELPVCPMRFFGAADRARLEAGFAEVGDRFFHLSMSAPFRFVAYTGFLAFEASNSLVKRKADGRVMVDLRNFARMHPGYRMGDAHPPTDTLRSAAAPHPKPEPEELQLAPAIVYGFSFTLKCWGCFDVMGFSEISFDSTAFDELVMQDPEQKDMLLSLVSQYVHPQQPQDAPPLRLDAISSKGTGRIFLCYGPPGTGKTLTAESLAEKLECPLWAMSAFELPGSEPAEMEARLLQIFDIAVSWKAILLLDEADVYMERRRSGGRSNSAAMTGVFLRLLEYYAGVLFLTTNRVAVFDEAFRSRISMLVEYPPLSEEQRGTIWAKLLSKGGLPTDKAEDLAWLAKHTFNGREIRNMLLVALTWAQSRKRQVSMKDVRSVVRMSISSLEALKAAASSEENIRMMNKWA